MSIIMTFGTIVLLVTILIVTLLFAGASIYAHYKMSDPSQQTKNQ